MTALILQACAPSSSLSLTHHPFHRYLLSSFFFFHGSKHPNALSLSLRHCSDEMASSYLAALGVVIVLVSSAAARPAYYGHEDTGMQVDSLPFKTCGTGAWDVFALELEPYPMVKVCLKRERQRQRQRQTDVRGSRTGAGAARVNMAFCACLYKVKCV